MARRGQRLSALCCLHCGFLLLMKVRMTRGLASRNADTFSLISSVVALVIAECGYKEDRTCLCKSQAAIELIGNCKARYTSRYWLPFNAYTMTYIKQMPEMPSPIGFHSKSHICFLLDAVEWNSVGSCAIPYFVFCNIQTYTGQKERLHLAITSHGHM